MARKKRLSKRKASPNKKRSAAQEGEPFEISAQLRLALDRLPKPARAIFDRVREFKRAHPHLFDVMTRDVDSERYREFERHLERVQERKRRGS
jgi:hypothetical protein